MVHLLHAGRQLGLAAAVYYSGLGTETPGCAHGIHGDIAAAHHYDLLALIDGGVVFFFPGVHEVGAGEHLIGREDTVEVLAGYVHEAGKPCSRADEHGVEALFIHEGVYGESAPHHYVCLDLHAELLHACHLSGHYALLGETEFRNAVYEHASSLVEGFEDCHVVAEASKVAGAGES